MPDRHPAVVRAAAEDRGAELVLVAPHLLALPQVVGEHHVVRRGDVHHAVHHDRRVLEAPQPLDVGLDDHARHQPRHILRADLVERRVALVGVVAAVHEPVTGRRIQQHLRCDHDVRDFLAAVAAVRLRDGQ